MLGNQLRDCSQHNEDPGKKKETLSKLEEEFNAHSKIRKMKLKTTPFRKALLLSQPSFNSTLDELKEQLHNSPARLHTTKRQSIALMLNCYTYC